MEIWERNWGGKLSTHTLAKDTSKTLLLHSKNNKEEERKKSINIQGLYNNEEGFREEGVE